MNASPGTPCSPTEHEEPSMSDEHPLEQLLRDAKDKDDLNAAAQGAELRKTFELQERVQARWVQSKASLIDEIERANAVLAKHALRERYAFRELPDSGPGNISRGNLALGYAPPSKSPRAEYDVTVIAGDGRIILLHRASGQRHQNLTVFTALGKNWEAILTGLYRDHLKKGREPAQNVPLAGDLGDRA